ncbi:MAG: hypothetical protein R2865_03155 [Deinococcales bacterium]
MLFTALGFPYSLAQSCLAELQGDTVRRVCRSSDGAQCSTTTQKSVDVPLAMPIFSQQQLALNYIALDDLIKDAEFLAKRYLLPLAGDLMSNQEIWSTMLKWFSAGMILTASVYTESLTKGELIADPEALINLASQKVRH